MAKRVTTDVFIERARKVHGNIYDYSATAYSNAQTKVTIICPEHGAFHQLPSNHLKPSGCPRCGTEAMASRTRSDVDSFIKRARVVHSNRYDYSLVEYNNARTRVRIICLEHGEFKQAPYNHLNGNRCPACAGRPISDTESFITRARSVHGDRYSYDEVEYVSAHSPVIIHCTEHGAFSQR